MNEENQKLLNFILKFVKGYIIFAVTIIGIATIYALIMIISVLITG